MKLDTIQMRAFQRAALDEFDRRMVDHLKCEFRGDARLDISFVRDARARAAGYGLQLEFEVCLFLYVVMLVGADFERRPEYGWIGEALRAPTDPTAPESPIEAVFDRLMTQKGKTGGGQQS